MLKVWKYELELDDWADLELPVYSKILKVKGYVWQENFSWKHKINIWILVNPDPGCLMETRRFRIAGTGHEIDVTDTERYKYIDTIFLEYPSIFGGPGNELVFHIFEDRL